MVCAEAPDVVFFDTEIVRWIVCVGRVGVYRLALNIIELEFLVRVFHWDDRGDSHHVLLLGLVRLVPLEDIGLCPYGLVVHVLVLVRIVRNDLVKARHRVVDFR